MCPFTSHAMSLHSVPLAGVSPWGSFRHPATPRVFRKGARHGASCPAAKPRTWRSSPAMSLGGHLPRAADADSLHTPSDADSSSRRASEPFCPPECVALAHDLADAARPIVDRYFRLPLDIELKSDESPVTIADRQVEAAVKSLIRSASPSHAVLGEEGGLEGGDADPEYVWVIDPIDGTASFVTGKPLFGVLIALTHRGVPVLGVIDQPYLKERWVGVRGQPTTFNGRPVKTRNCASLSSAYLYSTSPHLFPGASEDAFHRLRQRVRRTGYGCDCYAAGLLSLGFADIMAEFGTKPWDYMALVCVVEGAGGVITDWCGNPLKLSSFDPKDWGQGDILACSSVLLHRQALDALAWK